MYIRITSKCSMLCKHCNFACTKDGEDMCLTTLKAALDYGDGIICIGGGEPTIHPQFWEMFALILGHKYTEDVFIVTNGSMTTTSIALAKLAKAGVIGAALSQDEWHDEINDDVVEAFTRSSGDKRNSSLYGSDYVDRREIRTVTKLAYGGRCDWGDKDCCPCPEITVEPNGDVYSCGCYKRIKLGDVFNGFDIPDDQRLCINK